MIQDPRHDLLLISLHLYICPRDQSTVNVKLPLIQYYTFIYLLG